MAFVSYGFILFLSLALHTKLKKKLAVKLLIFSVRSSIYFVIYSKICPLFGQTFNHVFEVFQGVLFALLLYLKDALGTRLLKTSKLAYCTTKEGNLSPLRDSVRLTFAKLQIELSAKRNMHVVLI